MGSLTLLQTSVRQCLSFYNSPETFAINQNCNTFFLGVCKEHVFDFLYRMEASRYILFWPPRGQLLRNKPIILVTNITELVECVQRQFLITIM